MTLGPVRVMGAGVVVVTVCVEKVGIYTSYIQIDTLNSLCIILYTFILVMELLHHLGVPSYIRLAMELYIFVYTVQCTSLSSPTNGGMSCNSTGVTCYED